VFRVAGTADLRWIVGRKKRRAPQRRGRSGR
jgi:hypothetical protein